jgi:beta-lactamase regulating signal transducer with metallopeptidase domain
MSMEANEFRQLISTGLAQLLIASIWQGLLLAAFAWAALGLLPRLRVPLRASTRFALWLIIFFTVALLPCFALIRSVFATHSTAPAGPNSFALQVNIVWAFGLVGVWAIASLISLLRLLVSVVQTRRLFKNSSVLDPTALSEEMRRTLTRPDARSAEVRLSSDIDTPSVIGFLRPAIVMPQALWNELTEENLNQILLHEMAHLRRGDDWVNLLQKFLRALCPLNPALLWVERELCREREQACDDAVLAANGNPRGYATCLTRLAETRLVRSAASLAPGLWKRHSELAARVDNILYRRGGSSPLVSRALVAASFLLTLSAAASLQRLPGVVNFASSAEMTATASPAPAARFLPARSDVHDRAQFQNAVFHPSASQTAAPRAVPAVSIKAADVSKKVHRTTPQVWLVQISSSYNDAGETVSVTYVTVTSGQPLRAAQAARALATFSIPDNWIDSQI